MTAETTERLFSYGTLQQAEVQISTFGRRLEGRADALTGWRLEWVKITDEAVIAASGSDRHPILVAGAPDDAVEGTVFLITPAELAAADDYEVDDYRRVAAQLRAGGTAWVYVQA
ncbi:gamma-glutamylcyclotransferase family protein [Caulobacter sp. 17J65-9]|uniref:gamma-glutamylcyclotransferase family protein n=1 Tax=Caulobacter sp. 17J65-9 TaxID=2709382 RepID=UPI0013C5B03C|nr:gamma-glutamylcyclotransferase family protein [Caulobacter sp. 17J65-9]NEX94979.1 gamma-glutamylcyclotransferase [Caulobacter sp. 17J65-9]